MREMRSRQDEEKKSVEIKDDLLFKADFYNVALCRPELREELFKINRKYPSCHLKLFDENVLEKDKKPTTFTIDELCEQFNQLKSLKILILASTNPDEKDKELRIIAEYKVLLLNIIYEQIRDPNRKSHIPLHPNIELSWRERTWRQNLAALWSTITNAADWISKRLQFIALALTKLAALFLPLLIALTEGVPAFASLFSIQLVLTASPVLLATLTASAAFVSLISVYYYLPYLLQWLGITSPQQDKPLLQFKQEECVIMENINNRLEHTLLNLTKHQYEALINLIKPINEEIITLKLPPHQREMRVKLVRFALGIFNIVASAHSAIGITSLFSTATALTSGFGGTAAAASLIALSPLLQPIAIGVLFIGFFSWAQFLVSATVLNALDREGAAHTQLTNTLTNFHAPSPETFDKILAAKTRLELTDKQITLAKEEAEYQKERAGFMLEHKMLRKKEPYHKEMYERILKNSSNQASTTQDGTKTLDPTIDNAKILPLWKDTLQPAKVQEKKEAPTSLPLTPSKQQTPGEGGTGS